MKTRISALLTLGCLSGLLFLGISRAQQSATEQAVYELHFASVADSKHWECVWYVTQQGSKTNSPPIGVVYRSLSSPALHQWVSDLPKGTRIEYQPSSLPMIGPIFIPEKEIPAFKRFCQSKSVTFNDGFPTL